MDQELGQIRKPGVFTALIGACILMAFGVTPATAAKSALKIPASLEGKAYKTARAKIIAAGWRPDYRTASMEWEKAVQRRYPELRYCAVDRPLCALYFTGKNGSCLKVVTRGEAPEEYRIETVARECDDTPQ